MANASLPHLHFPATNGETRQVAQFRLLRERLLELPVSRIVLVTSPETAEGKSTVAANLALCLAEFGRSQVVLLEANFRTPVLAPLFSTPQGGCFATQLMNRQRGLRQPIRPVTLPGHTVHVLAVSPGAAAAVSVAWPAFQSVMEELRQQSWIQHIVIDGPPTLGSADTKLLAQQSDQVLLSAMAGRTRGPRLSEAAKQLAPAKVAGVVLLEQEKEKR